MTLWKIRFIVFYLSCIDVCTPTNRMKLAFDFRRIKHITYRCLQCTVSVPLCRSRDQYERNSRLGLTLPRRWLLPPGQGRRNTCARATKLRNSQLANCVIPLSCLSKARSHWVCNCKYWCWCINVDAYTNMSRIYEINQIKFDPL